MPEGKESTLKIRVTGYSKFKAVMGNRVPAELEMEAGTLRDALELISKRYGKKFEEMVFDPQTREVKRSNLVMLNGQSYLNLRGGLRIELKDGDEIVFMPALVGG
jgi:MoaD family protein